VEIKGNNIIMGVFFNK